MTRPERSFERVGRSGVLTVVPSRVTPLVAGRWAGDVAMTVKIALRREGQAW